MELVIFGIIFIVFWYWGMWRISTWLEDLTDVSRWTNFTILFFIPGLCASVSQNLLPLVFNIDEIQGLLIGLGVFLAGYIYLYNQAYKDKKHAEYLMSRKSRSVVERKIDKQNIKTPTSIDTPSVFKTSEISRKTETQNTQSNNEKIEKPSGFRVIKKVKD